MKKKKRTNKRDSFSGLLARLFRRPGRQTGTRGDQRGPAPGAIERILKAAGLGRRQIGLNPGQLSGGRVSVDSSSSTTLPGTLSVVAPTYAEEQWRTFYLDYKTLGRIALPDLLRLMADLSPEISSGIWYFLRLSNPGWEYKVYRPGTKDTSPEGTAVVDDLIGLLAEYYGSPDVQFNRLFISAFLRGALFAELVLDTDKLTAADLAVPDPESARFVRVEDPIRGQIWELAQWQNGKLVSLNYPTIRYIPIDSLPGVPYGRAPVYPALFSALFLISILHDLKRVIMQQGYPRIDVSIVLEQLLDLAPEDATPGSEELKTWIDKAISDIEDTYASLAPDDAYIHMDAIQINRPVGTVDSSSLGAVDSLISIVERMAARGLKTMPLLMGINDSTTETNAIRQWEIQAAAIKSIQHLAEALLERLLTLAVRVEGIQADVEFRFAELRDSELLRDEQALAAKIANVITMYNQGWISQDAASNMITGLDPDLPVPRVTSALGLASPSGTLSTEIAETRSAVTRAIELLTGDPSAGLGAGPGLDSLAGWGRSIPGSGSYRTPLEPQLAAVLGSSVGQDRRPESPNSGDLGPGQAPPANGSGPNE